MGEELTLPPRHMANPTDLEKYLETATPEQVEEVIQIAQAIDEGPYGGYRGWNGWRDPTTRPTAAEMEAEMAEMLEFGRRNDEFIDLTQGDFDKEALARDLYAYMVEVVEWLNVRGEEFPTDPLTHTKKQSNNLIEITGMWANWYRDFGDDARASILFIQTYERTGIFPILESDQGFADGTRRIRALERIGG